MYEEVLHISQYKLSILNLYDIQWTSRSNELNNKTINEIWLFLKVKVH